MIPRRFVIDFARPDEWLNANDREHHMIKAAKVKAWRRAAATACIEAGIPRLERVEFIAEPRWTDKRRRDALNASPTIKACIDGVVDAGVLADDADRYVHGVLVRNGPPAKGLARLRLTIVEVAS